MIKRYLVTVCNETHNFHFFYLLNLLDSDNEIKSEDDKKGKLFLGGIKDYVRGKNYSVYVIHHISHIPNIIGASEYFSIMQLIVGHSGQVFYGTR